MWYDQFPSSFGDILVAGDGEAIRLLHFQQDQLGRQQDQQGRQQGQQGRQQGRQPHAIGADWRPDAHLFRTVREELLAYFQGELQAFSVPVAPIGTPFQRQVWQALQGIPYGQLASYRDIATRIGNPKAVRAVGAANGANPVAIIVPCHRVIGSNGTLTGYAGGLEIKDRLLRLEAEYRSAYRQEALAL